AVEKSPTAFNLLYRGALVYGLQGRSLRNATYGGKEPDLSCELVHSTNDMIAWVLGHQKDLLIAFGIIREGGEVTAVQRLIWFPHDGRFNPIRLMPNHEILVRYGRKNDLNTRICWNPTSTRTWAFSGNHRVASPGPCEPGAAPYNPTQRRIDIGK